MRYILAIVAAAATALLAVAPAAANPAGTILIAAATAAQGQPVDRAFLMGSWTDTNDCTNAVDFRADGTFLTTQGAQGRWTLEGDRLTFQGNSTVVARVQARDGDNITLTHPDGSVGASSRCGSRRTMPPLPATPAEALAMSQPLGSSQILLGRWTDDGNCAVTITFAADGQFTVPTGRGRWTLVGERLTFTGATQVAARVRQVGRDRILLIHDNGTIGQSVRC